MTTAASLQYTLDTHKDLTEPSPLNKADNFKYFEAEREKLLVQQAYDTGFIQDLSKEFILNDSERSLDDVFVLSYSGLHIRAIDGAQFCYRLTICNLSNNFITDISPLQSCPNLIKIDLSSNQITSFPYSDFWASFSYLQFLLLHDNGIGKLSDIQNIALAPQLEYLTLYDTPISIRPSYRHHVVNSIVTLKVLDYHLVADSEVIEDANFGGKFQPLSDYLHVPLAEMLNETKCEDISQPPSLQSELSCLQNVIRRTNSVMAKHSPVLVIQKTVRGYFARRFRKYLIENRIWITGERIDRVDFDSKKETTDATKQEDETKIEEELKTETEPQSENPNEDPPHKNVHVRFDERDLADECADDMNDLRIDEKVRRDYTNLLPQAPMPTPKMTIRAVPVAQDQPQKELSRNQQLAKEKLDRLKHVLRSVTPDDVRPYMNSLVDDQPKSNLDWLKIASDSHQIKVDKKERELLKIERTQKAKEREAKKQDVEEEKEIDETKVQFRLRGNQVPIEKNSALKNHLMNVMESSKDVRMFHEKYHEEQENKQIPKAPKYKFTTLDQLIYAKHKGCMSLATFLAVDKAYQAKAKEDLVQSKQEKVYQMRVDKKKAKQIILLKSKSKAKKFSNLQNYDENITRAAMKERQDYYNFMKDKYVEKRERECVRLSDKKKDYKFAKEFASHCSSIGNALKKHDLKVKKEDRALVMSRRVQDIQETREEQKAVIKKYVEQRQKVLQAESNADKTEVELKILQNAKQRREEIKERVEELKQIKREVKELYPVPLHIHVGKRPATRPPPIAPNDSIYSVYSFSGKEYRRAKSPLARLADRRILTNKSYDVIHQRVRSAGSTAVTPQAIVHIHVK